MTDHKAELEWKDGVPVSTRFGDPYFSFSDGLAESRYVFLDGNDLRRRLRPGFRVAELGIGTGLNLLCLIDLVRETGTGPVRYTGFELYPMALDDMIAALAAFPALAGLSGDLVAAWRAGTGLRTPDVEAEFVFGDARLCLPGWTAHADAWFLDGFAPARNPELWEPGLLAEVARHTAPKGTAATYSAAGSVRRGLAEAGFAVERRPGFGRKRHMTVARLA